MKEFSEWRENKDNLNESASAADAIRARLNNDYLKNAFTGTPYEGQINRAVQETSTLKPEEQYSSITQSISDLEKRITEQLNKEKSDIDKKVAEPEKVEEQVIEHTAEPIDESVSDLYKLYRDREETFECNISVEGASLSSAQVRLVIDTNLLNVIFYGKLYKDGRCLVPLKKMTMFPEGAKGQIRLEVVVDDTLFSPWESTCVVEGAKKVSVDIKQKKGVSINFGTTND
jgi:predicted  nucleic acid-binding Zn-ribbon protein